MKSLGPCHDFVPMMEQAQEQDTLRELYNFTVNQLSIIQSREDESDDDKSDWEGEGDGDEFERNAFDAFVDLENINCLL